MGFVGSMMINFGYSNKETHRIVFHLGPNFNHELVLMSNSTNEIIILAVQLNLIEDQAFRYATFFEHN